jgi:hypothetical protein
MALAKALPNWMRFGMCVNGDPHVVWLRAFFRLHIPGHLNLY